jgi:hypothetical protein
VDDISHSQTLFEGFPSKYRMDHHEIPVCTAMACELVAVTDRPGSPVLLPQIIEQWQTLFQFFDVLAHALFCLWRRR